MDNKIYRNLCGFRNNISELKLIIFAQITQKLKIYFKIDPLCLVVDKKGIYLQPKLEKLKQYKRGRIKL